MPLCMIHAASVPLMRGKPLFLTPRPHCSVVIEYVLFSLRDPTHFRIKSFTGSQDVYTARTDGGAPLLLVLPRDHLCSIQ